MKLSDDGSLQLRTVPGSMKYIVKDNSAGIRGMRFLQILYTGLIGDSKSKFDVESAALCKTMHGFDAHI